MEVGYYLTYMYVFFFIILADVFIFLTCIRECTVSSLPLPAVPMVQCLFGFLYPGPRIHQSPAGTKCTAHRDSHRTRTPVHSIG